MTDYTVKLVRRPAAKDLRAIQNGLVAHNTQFTKTKNFSQVVVFARDRKRRLVGGCVGEVFYNWLFIKWLWTSPKHRGEGLGDALLSAAETEGKRRGCHSVWLDTFEFQARPFYLARGYQDFGRLENFPAPFPRYFLQKQL